MVTYVHYKLTLGFGISPRVECFLPVTILTITLKPRTRILGLLNDCLCAIRTLNLFGFDLLHFLAEVLHMEETATIENDLLLSAAEECYLEGCKIDDHLNTITSDSGAFAVHRPLEIVRDTGFLDECPLRRLVVALAQTIDLIHAHTHYTILMYAHVERKLDVRVDR
jgi:hypothetical protein